MPKQNQSAPEEFSQTGSMPEIFYLIEQVEKKLKQIQRHTIRATNLTPPQYFMLTLLWAQDGQPFKDLAAAGGYTRATITDIVDTLEKKGLVTRQPHPNDRRSLLVKLTAAGRALQNSTPSVERIFKNCCVGLETGEGQQLSRLLKKLNDSLSL